MKPTKKIDETYGDGKMEPNTPRAQYDRNQAINNVKNDLHDIIKKLEAMPKTNHHEEIPDLIQSIKDILSTDGGEAGLEAWAISFKEEISKGTMKNTKKNIASIRSNQAKFIEEKLAKLTGKQVIYLEKKEEIEIEVPAEKEAPSTSTPILGNIIPDSSIKVMDSYLATVLGDIAEQVAELQTVRKSLTKKATAGSEDYYAKVEKCQFNLKQVARLAQFASNTIIANKFDKELLGKILDNKSDL